MLVRQHGVAGQNGNAHQRFFVGNYNRGCGEEPGRDDRHRTREGTRVSFSEMCCAILGSCRHKFWMD